MFCNTLGDFTFSFRLKSPVACESLYHMRQQAAWRMWQNSEAISSGT